MRKTILTAKRKRRDLKRAQAVGRNDIGRTCAGNARADSLDHLTATADMTRRQVVSSTKASRAQKAAADPATKYAQYMLWSVIVSAVAAVASAISALVIAYSV
jgi:hypothetical protein